MEGLPKVGAEVWTVERHLDSLPQAIRDLYTRFISLVEACGPFVYSVTKTAITLKGERRGFAGAKPKPQWLDGYLDLQRPLRDERIRRVSPYTKKLYVHQFRVSETKQLDSTFALWIREAYEVGAGLHLGNK
jgi:Domain of unknown function (DUF5655)